MHLYLHFSKLPGQKTKTPQAETIEGWFEIEGIKVYQCISEEGFENPDLTNNPETIKRTPILQYFPDMGHWFYGAQEVEKFSIVKGD